MYYIMKEKKEKLRTTGRTLDEERVKGLKDNAMLKHRPELFYEWDFEKNDEIGLDVYKVTRGSGKKAWWRCKKCGSNYDSQIHNRVPINGRKSTDCPYCAGKRINKTNSLATTHPHLVDEWDFNKNGDKTPHTIGKGHSTKVWWICSHGHSWDMVVYSRTSSSGSGCPYCSGKRVDSTNCIVATHPHIAKEWDFSKNKASPYSVTFGTHRKAWWICPKGHSYESMINNRTTKNSGCPYCVGQKTLVGFNDLWTMNPKIASQLVDKNIGFMYTEGSGFKAKWRCDVGHEWEAPIRDRTGYELQGCPYCSGHRVLKGFNDLWTSHPELAKHLKNEEDGYRLSKGSNTYVDWICSECLSTSNKQVNEIVRRGYYSCAGCSDGTSFGERMIYHLLNMSNIEFLYDKKLPWSENKRYDFYIEEDDLKCIVEVHGSQHYRESPFHREGNTFEDTVKNDKFKEKLARENGIEKYIVIDCEESRLDYVVNSIKNSELKHILLENIDYIEAGRRSSNSFIIYVCNLWSSGMRSTKEISEFTNLNRGTVTIYLKRGAEIGICDYDPTEEIRKNGRETGLKMKNRQRC